MFRNNLLKLQKSFSEKYEFINIVVDSEGTNKEVFSQHEKFMYFDYPNFPISDKWLYGLHKLKNIDYDYVFMMGSDNTIDNQVFQKYSSFIDKGIDLIGITDMYAYSLEKEQLFYWGGYPKKHMRYGETIGLGRCLSKSLVEIMDYELWDRGINKGLDSTMTRRLGEIANQSLNIFSQESFSIRNVGLACDIKSGFNITNLEDFIDSSEIVENLDVLNNYKRSLIEE